MTTPTKPAPRVFHLSIRGMTCAACSARIEKRLNDLDHVSATVNYANDEAIVQAPYDYQVQALIDEIEKAGYVADEIHTGEPTQDDSVEDDKRVLVLKWRFIVAVLLFMPLCDASLGWDLPHTSYWRLFILALAAPVVLWAAWPIHTAAFRAARHRTSTMDTLVSMGIITSTAWSLYVLFAQDHVERSRPLSALLGRQPDGALYLDVAAGVTMFLLIGRYYEAISKRRTGNVLRSLASVGAKEASLLEEDGSERTIPIEHVRAGDRIVVRPGERVPIDGQVLMGRADLDVATITGESRPVEVREGKTVTGGTIALSGRLVVRATHVGNDTQLAQMIKLVEQAQNEKAAVQRLADRISSVFVPIVLTLALLTFVTWFAASASSERALSAGLALLIIACPCALGLATPTALYVATGRGAQLGIFIKGHQALESSRTIDTVVLDKTGTVTEGRMTVADIEVVPGATRQGLLMYAGSVEQASEHAIAAAVVKAARNTPVELLPVDAFHSLAGLGTQGQVAGLEVIVGNTRLVTELGMTPSPILLNRITDWEEAGHSSVLVAVDREVIGALAVSDRIKPSAFTAISQLKALGLRCVLLSGDNEATTQAVGRATGCDGIAAGVLPGEKVAFIKDLQATGRSVAFVGDGVNDGPALVVSDLGLAIGSGTDVAIDAADMILVHESLATVSDAIRLARSTLRTIRMNLGWAFAYNVAAIPLAAVGFLNPLIAGASMTLSSVFVVWNSSRLRHFTGGQTIDDQPVARPLPNDLTSKHENDLFEPAI